MPDAGLMGSLVRTVVVDLGRGKRGRTKFFFFLNLRILQVPKGRCRPHAHLKYNLLLYLEHFVGHFFRIPVDCACNIGFH